MTIICLIDKFFLSSSYLSTFTLNTYLQPRRAIYSLALWFNIFSWIWFFNTLTTVFKSIFFISFQNYTKYNKSFGYNICTVFFFFYILVKSINQYMVMWPRNIMSKVVKQSGQSILHPTSSIYWPIIMELVLNERSADFYKYL